jgi:hypothetical protein
LLGGAVVPLRVVVSVGIVVPLGIVLSMLPVPVVPVVPLVPVAVPGVVVGSGVVAGEGIVVVVVAAVLVVVAGAVTSLRLQAPRSEAISAVVRIIFGAVESVFIIGSCLTSIKDRQISRGSTSRNIKAVGDLME